ncbi:Histone H2B.1/H2B.2 [Chelonia mydas]|uniref:Histone H2B.1/H2B.2 n=1 Tax=Chelonia mydas TaxID=8469 RepID=M7CFQ5_CHEMY|nr:Histone H2B.1/H2B.2 [Chelonia mydas]
MLQQMTKVRMSAKAKGLMKSFMADLYSQVSTEAEHLRKQKQLPARYASKMLQQMTKVRMSAKAKGLMKSFMADLYSQVSTEAEHLRKQKQLPASEVRAALQQVMPREVAKHSATPVCNESA